MLSKSMISLIRQSLHIRIMPKFSAYVLSESLTEMSEDLTGSGIFVKSGS